jgi:hypothetical protein
MIFSGLMSGSTGYTTLLYQVVLDNCFMGDSLEQTHLISVILLLQSMYRITPRGISVF